jgi:hypothetical protein
MHEIRSVPSGDGPIRNTFAAFRRYKALRLLPSRETEL